MVYKFAWTIQNFSMNKLNWKNIFFFIFMVKLQPISTRKAFYVSVNCQHSDVYQIKSWVSSLYDSNLWNKLDSKLTSSYCLNIADNHQTYMDKIQHNPHFLLADYCKLASDMIPLFFKLSTWTTLYTFLTGRELLTYLDKLIGNILPCCSQPFLYHGLKLLQVFSGGNTDVKPWRIKEVRNLYIRTKPGESEVRYL